MLHRPLSFFMTKNGFTLTEIIVVIVILGVMATMMIPRLAAQQEASVFSEGVTAVQTLYGAQKRYKLDHSAFTSTANCSDLDVTLTPKNFTLSCAASGSAIVTATRATPAYTITVSDDEPTGLYDCPACKTTPSLNYLVKYIPH